MNRRGCVALIVAGLLSAPAQAEVISYQLLKLRAFQQTADNTAPIDPSSHVFVLDLLTTPGQFRGGSLEGPAGGDLPLMGPFIEEPGVEGHFVEQDFATQEELDNAFPDNNQYIIEAVTPDRTVMSEVVDFQTSFPEAVPFFTGAVFRSLQEMDSSRDFTFTFPETPAGLQAVLLIDDELQRRQVFRADVTGETSFVLPGGTLEPGREHLAVIAYADVAADPLDDFTEGAGRSLHAAITEVAFRTLAVPEPTVVLLAVTSMLTLAAVLRPRP